FVYYSGHGLAVSGSNYLIPVDLDDISGRSVVAQGVQLDAIVKQLYIGAPNAAHFIVFDACRNIGGRKGPKRFVPSEKRPGMVIAFASDPNTSALDVGEGSGPFARALAEAIVMPGDHLNMFYLVRTAVATRTRNEQIPWVSDGLLRRVCVSA